MLKLIYIIALTLMFNSNTGSIQVPIFLKFTIGIVATAVFLVPDILKNKKIKGAEYVCWRNYILPIVLMIVWSLIIWTLTPPSGFNFSNITRMLSNSLLLLLSITVSIASIRVFREDAIKYSVIAILLSIILNCIDAINIYGLNLFVEYLPQALFSTNFAFNSPLYNLTLVLEVQDATLSCGFYILYFLFFDKKDSFKEKRKYIIILLLCSYIGFKRTEFIGIILTSVIILFMKKFNPKHIIILIGMTFSILCMLYVIVVKNNMFSSIVQYLNSDVTGRTNIYSWLADYFELSLTYIGKGFTYVDKTMFELTGFASHNTIVRMYAELGCIPFIIWLYWYLLNIPLKMLKKNDKSTSLNTFACILYLFFTYCIGNSMNFICIQYSFIIVQIFPMFMYEAEKNVLNNNLKEEQNEDSNIIYAKSL